MFDDPTSLLAVLDVSPTTIRLRILKEAQKKAGDAPGLYVSPTTIRLRILKEQGGCALFDLCRVSPTTIRLRILKG